MEVDVIRRTANLRSFNASLYFILSKIVVFLTFVAYVLMGNTLAPNKVRNKNEPKGIWSNLLNAGFYDCCII